ncbi:type I secretion C-terminal target domain-containing protein, partial [Desulfosarcina sp. OttesenSCG-928-A07]|nr:type I secretion C-terminal target domain-containing protein [Desulfosarcina sp. OttesenSCG-928-A07]
DVLEDVAGQLSSGQLPTADWFRDVVDSILKGSNLNEPPSSTWITNAVNDFSEQIGDSGQAESGWARSTRMMLLDTYGLSEAVDGHYETQVLPVTYDFRTSMDLFGDVSAFKGRGWSNSKAEDGLNSSTLQAWMKANTATVSKSASGLGVSGNAGTLLSFDGNKIGSAKYLTYAITEAVLMTLIQPTDELSISFGDVTFGERGTVFFYGADGDYLGTKAFGGLNIFSNSFSGVDVAENEFSEAIGSFLVIPTIGSFTVASMTVSETQEVWVGPEDTSSNQMEVFSVALSGVGVSEDTVDDAENLDSSDIQMLIEGTANGGILNGGENDALIKGGSGDDVIYAGEGNNQIWGNDGADTFVWTDDHLGIGLDEVMDFDFEEGDRLDLSALVKSTVSDLSLEDNVLSFSIESDAGQKTVDVHLSNVPNLEAITAEYIASNGAEREDLLTDLINTLSVV